MTCSVNKTAFEIAKELYAKKELDLNQILLHYAEIGYVFISPTYVLIGREFDDYWFIECAVGEGCLQEFLRLMPFYKPWIVWARPMKGRTSKYFSTEKLKRLLS